MNDAQKLALIQQLPAIIAGLVAAVGAVLGFINRGKLQEVHLALNSRLDELVTAARDSGRILERTHQAEQDAKVPTVLLVQSPPETKNP